MYERELGRHSVQPSRLPSSSSSDQKRGEAPRLNVIVGLSSIIGPLLLHTLKLVGKRVSQRCFEVEQLGFGADDGISGHLELVPIVVSGGEQDVTVMYD